METCRLVQSLCSALLIMLLSSATAKEAPGDSTVETPLPPDEGSGPDDEDMADLFAGVISTDVIFHCYKCIGVTADQGCNATSFYLNPSEYVTECSGHCLNISAESSGTVYDCTEGVPAKSAHCFNNGGMQMCVCASDLCNGPPPRPPDDVILLPTSQSEVNISLPDDIIQSPSLDGVVNISSVFRNDSKSPTPQSEVNSSTHSRNDVIQAPPLRGANNRSHLQHEKTHSQTPKRHPDEHNFIRAAEISGVDSLRLFRGSQFLILLQICCFMYPL